jgi:truncated hemoglobin YjbI
MTRRKPSSEGLYLARRIAHRNRLEGAGLSAETADRWLTAWEAEARERGLDPRSGDFWTDAEGWIADH